MLVDTPRRDRSSAVTFMLISLVVALTALAGCEPNQIFGSSDSRPKSGDLKVLFIGNSLTFWFEMPYLLECLLEAGGTPAFVADASIGGTNLNDHLDIAATRLAVTQEAWDVVVLQDGRYEIVLPASRAGIIGDFQEWRDRIRSECPQARIVMYLDYALDQDFEVAGIPYTRGEFTSLLRQATLIVADSLGLEVAPVGWAWERVMVEHPEFYLYDKDETHPGRMGQYLHAVRPAWSSTPHFPPMSPSTSNRWRARSC